MEAVLAPHPDVAKCAVVGIADEIKGEVPLGFVVTKSGSYEARGTSRGNSWQRAARRSVRSRPSRWRSSSSACPQTRSGKILRGTMKIADGIAYGVPATNDDPAIFGGDQ